MSIFTSTALNVIIHVFSSSCNADSQCKCNLYFENAQTSNTVNNIPIYSRTGFFVAKAPNQPKSVNIAKTAATLHVFNLNSIDPSPNTAQF